MRSFKAPAHLRKRLASLEAPTEHTTAHVMVVGPLRSFDEWEVSARLQQAELKRSIRAEQGEDNGSEKPNYSREHLELEFPTLVPKSGAEADKFWARRNEIVYIA